MKNTSFKQWVEERSDPLAYHLSHGIPLRQSIYRIGSEAYADLFARARKERPEGLDETDCALLDDTEIGEWGEYEGRRVPLDMPLELPDKTAVHEGAKAEYQGKEVELDEPARGGSKKYYVYTRNPKTGKVVRVEFGYPGMDVGTSDLERSKNFATRHKCSEKTDKTKPGWWSCMLPRYAKQLGLSEPAYKYW